jgi:hypothetical protein
MAAYNTTIGRIYSTPHSKNAWAWLNTPGGWRQVDGTSTDGHTNTHLVLTAARDSGKSVSVTTDAADSKIIAVYL